MKYVERKKNGEYLICYSRVSCMRPLLNCSEMAVTSCVFSSSILVIVSGLGADCARWWGCAKTSDIFFLLLFNSNILKYFLKQFFLIKINPHKKLLIAFKDFFSVNYMPAMLLTPAMLVNDDLKIQMSN